jgi:hypothetical protein
MLQYLVFIYMNIVNIINEVIAEVVQNKVWYHGTPDIRDIKRAGNFVPRTAMASYITDPQKWNELQTGMQKAREAGDEKLYFELLKDAGTLHGRMEFKKPIFFTDNYGVANTYANDKRAFDYQESIPNTIKANIDDNGKILKVPAHGEKFRGIRIDAVREALNNDGVDNNTIDKYLQMFQDTIRAQGTKLTTDDLAVIAQQLGYDIVDVIGVIDSYQGGVTKSTVRMVFDPQRIKIIS